MDKLIIASMRQNAGKTSLIVGLAKALNQKIGYMKPLGDRLLYRKKQLWDHDAALMSHILGLADISVDMSLGFDHSKLRYIYDQESTKEKLLETVSRVEAHAELLLVEAGQDITYGISVYLDAITLAEQIGGRLLMVVEGSEDTILDDITFAEKYFNLNNLDFAGIIANKLHDIENFKDVFVPSINQIGVNVLGVIPYTEELTYYSVGYLSDRLFAKVITGSDGLNNVVQNILVGAMSANSALEKPFFRRRNNLVITGGDRTDMILAALESQAAGIILTNNILPPPNIISKALEQNTPLLLVTADTYEIARQVDNLQPLLTKDDTKKINLLAQLIQEHVNIDEIVNS